MVIDIHSHLYHPDWYPVKFQEYLAVDFFKRRKISLNSNQLGFEASRLNRMLSDNQGDKTIRVMDKAGIDKRVILIIDWGIEMGEAPKSIMEIHKEILGICSQNQDRLIGFAGVDPRRKDAPEILSFAFDHLEAKGLKLHPTSNGWSLADERVLRLVEMAAKRNLPIMVHTGSTIDILTSKHSRPTHVIRLAQIFPTATFIAGHSAFHDWRAFLNSNEIPPNLYFDISGWQDELSNNENNLGSDIKDIIRELPRKVFYGTDSPFYGFNFAPSESRWLQFVRTCANELNDRETNIFTPHFL